jgi:hypothetical protein
VGVHRHCPLAVDHGHELVMSAGILLSLAAGSGDTAMKRRPAPKETATAIIKTREEWREESKGLAVMPNGIDKLYAIPTGNFISDKFP